MPHNVLVVILHLLFLIENIMQGTYVKFSLEKFFLEFSSPQISMTLFILFIQKYVCMLIFMKKYFTQLVRLQFWWQNALIFQLQSKYC